MTQEVGPLINIRGAHRTVVSLWKAEKNCWKPLFAFGKKKTCCFSLTVLEPFFGQLHFLHLFTLTRSLALAVAWQSLSARTQSLLCLERLPHVDHQIFVDLALLSSISSMNARWILSLIFFHAQSIPPVCAHRAGLGPRSKCKRRRKIRSCKPSIKIVSKSKRRSC